MTLTPNSIDGALIFILLVFAFLSFLKGFIKDFFSTLNLILAIVISYAVSPIISKLISSNGTQQLMIELGTQFAVFIVLLIIFSIITSKISTPLAEKIPGAVNQSLGFGFGFVKGYVVLSFAFASLIYFYSYSDNKSPKIKERVGPEWLRKSKSYDFLEFGADLAHPIIENALSRAKGNESGEGAMGDQIDTIMRTKKLYDEIDKLNNGDSSALDSLDKKEPQQPDPQDSKPDVKSDKKDESGYTKQELDKMKRLIEIMSN
jgi:membrane protein required for colicin V production